MIYLLTGVDIVISTISGKAQISLIDAAAAAHVQNFVPSDFRGSPKTRSSSDPTDNGRSTAHQRLQYHASQSGMHYTIFTCGVFYERFAIGGLATSQIDIHKTLGGEGDFLVDMRKCQSKIPISTPSSTPSEFQIPNTYLCLTSARDAARFVVASLSLSSWPLEFKFRGQRMSTRELITICERVRGKSIRRAPKSSRSRC